MNRRVRGPGLALVGLVLVVGTLGVGAATAPNVVVSGGGDEATLVGAQGGGPGWHERGSVFLVRNASIQWTEDSADSYFDVTPLDNGTVLAGFMHSGYTEGCAPYDPPCTQTGFRVIDPDASGGPAVVEEYAFPVRSSQNSETHDVELLASGEYLVTDMEHERLFTVRNGTVTWEWNASNVYDAPPDPTRRDWLHLNDVDVINESHYLVSFRNSNQILIVGRDAGVVEVINEDRGTADEHCQLRGDQLDDFDDDGEIRCGDPGVMDHQHNPQWLGNGTVLVADSSNDRVVELSREDGRWRPTWTLTGAGGVDFHWPRDADRLANGNTLVTDTFNNRVVEVDENGSVVWSTRTPDDSPIAYEADRLPEGELVGGTSYESGMGGGQRGSVPGLSILLVGVRSVVPGTPFWVDERHLGLVLLGLVGMVAGSVDWYRQR
jgi:hypothetical protein